MACLTNAGYAKGCDASYGGIKKIAIYEKAAFNLTGMTVTAGVVTSVDLKNGYTGYTYDFLKDNSNWTEAIVGDGIMTSVHFTPVITLVFRKMSTTLRNEIMELTKGELVAFLTDYNNTTWMIGTDRGLQLSASAGGASGSKLEELNGETIILNGAETYKSYTIDVTSQSWYRATEQPSGW